MSLIAVTNIEIMQFLRDGGAYAAVLAVLWAILTKRLVPGWAYKQESEEKTMWRDLALRGTALARDILKEKT